MLVGRFMYGTLGLGCSGGDSAESCAAFLPLIIVLVVGVGILNILYHVCRGIALLGKAVVGDED